MKKLFLMMGLACLFMVACNNEPKQEQKQEGDKTEVTAENGEHNCPFQELKAKYDKWAELDDKAKQELNAEAQKLFADMDAKMKEEGKGCCEKAGEMKDACEKKLDEMTAEAKAECEKMKAECQKMQEAWNDFNNKSVDEQKDLIMGRLNAMGEGHKCNHEGDHQCNHEGDGHQCQHGEGQQCNHAK